MSRGRMRAMFTDSFSGAVGDLPKRKHGDDVAVLDCLRRDPKASTWDMTQALMDTIQRLIKRGAVREIPAAYPWFYYEVIEPPAAPPADRDQG